MRDQWRFMELSQARRGVFQELALGVQLLPDRYLLLLASADSTQVGGPLAAHLAIASLRNRWLADPQRAAERLFDDCLALDGELFHYAGAGETALLGLVLQRQANGEVYVDGAQVGQVQAWVKSQRQVRPLPQKNDAHGLLGSGEVVPALVQWEGPVEHLVAMTEGLVSQLGKRVGARLDGALRPKTGSIFAGLAALIDPLRDAASPPPRGTLLALSPC